MFQQVEIVKDYDLAIGIEQEQTRVPDIATELTIIVPTKNEAGNIGPLLERIEQSLDGLPVEIWFVDDSDDDTPQIVQANAGRFDMIDVNLLHRPLPERTGGLAGAVIAGIRVARSPYVCVMDGDLQHPPEVIPDMLKKLHEERLDLVVASRRVEGSDSRLLGGVRTLISLGLHGIAQIMFPAALRNISDPLAGFFILRRDAIDIERMHPKGFKILLEIMVRHPQLKKGDVPFNFGSRLSGKSKAGVKEAINYFNLLASLRFGENWLRPVGFGLVGLSGILVNTLVMALFTSLLGLHYLVSALLGTLASSTWNFILTEFWVFKAANRPDGRGKRFVLFFAINQVALLFRSPIIYGMTSILGLHYLISNFVSLVVLFLIRFIISDKWIWKSASSTEPVSSGINYQRRKTMKESSFYYNIHDIITVGSDVVLPELTPFQVNGTIDNPGMLVTVGKPRRDLDPDLKTQDPSIRHHYYREIFGRLGFEAEINIGKQIEIIASPLLQYSPHVLYTNLVEPVLRWSFVERGYALVHGATIAYDNRAYMITARTDTGKTTTLLKILNQQRRGTDKASFISDDMTILSPDGLVMTYPKPLTISHHTVRAVNPEVLNWKERFALFFQSRIHSRSGRKVAFFLGNTRLPMATINTIVQWLVPPPKYPVQRLVPNVKFAPAMCLAGLFIIERGNEAESEINEQEAIDILLSNCEDAYGFPPYESIKEFLYIVDGKDLRPIEQGIIRKAFDFLPATLVRSSNLTWWRRLPGYIDEEMAQYFNEKKSTGMMGRSPGLALSEEQA